jgi:putative ABC transport system substrate-binding protein
MRRRDFIKGFVGSAGAWPFAAWAQQREQMRGIGVLMAAASETDQQAGLAMFKEILHQLGWIDGRTSGGRYHGNRPARAGSAAASDALRADRV